MTDACFEWCIETKDPTMGDNIIDVDHRDRLEEGATLEKKPCPAAK